MPLKISRKPHYKILQAASFKPIPWLIHGFSTRPGGVSKTYGGRTLNLGLTREDARAAVERNRASFLRGLGALSRGRPWPLVTLRQIHSDLIHCVAGVPSPELAGDGLITQTPGILLAILTADCLPVILVDAKRPAVGVFHAGWRGTVKRIVEKGVGEMFRRFGTRPGDLRAAIGPGVHRCCYNVGPEVRTQFESQFEYGSKLFREVEESDPVREKYPLLFLTARAPGHSVLPKKIFLDLVEANRRQLLATGVAAKHINASPLCTACRTDLLFSYRAEKGVTGRMMAAVGIRP
ncbi:MAG TPA: peptidoglycan editing factor PgeF [Terriglobales bacterium]|nr:peptidoglycan editing factor PgeF [Terriglobales bacterium]